MEDVLYPFRGQHWRLSAGRSAYWEEERALVIADLHVGKSAHFRKAGIAVPANIVQDDLYRLQQLITRYNPVRVIVVGDMFHSEANNEVQYFKIWRRQFPNILFELISGNHDIMAPEVYEQLEIIVRPYLQLGDIYFVHDQKDQPKPLNGRYVLSGHIHPGVWMVGFGRQKLRLPCFYFGGEGAVLPAFSAFTGMYSVEPEASSTVFVIAEKKIFRV
ncbi:ligase-associated DNA damage response endonuclease PdeM [Chitinophaga barathri]|uniref:ligase-associated DNA damage response endonuclease PdeM n=1 Tax=Chitinophaga barathri TaxID=1647451 RepID=UPI0013C433AC|nr:ligase-associated DNA damage response endonuclease PdeM [Chitinophaga barathri]